MTPTHCKHNVPVGRLCEDCAYERFAAAIESLVAQGYITPAQAEEVLDR